MIGTPFLLAMVNDIPSGLQLVCRLFANDTKIGGKNADVDLTQRVLDKTTACAFRNAMVLNAAKSQYLYFEPNALPTIIFTYSTVDAIPLTQVHCTKDLGVQVDCSLSLSPQIDATAMKVNECLLSSCALSESSTFKFVTPNTVCWRRALPSFATLPNRR